MDLTLTYVFAPTVEQVLTTYTFDETPYRTFGPCPRCDAWGLDCPVDTPSWEVEELLAEHMRECTG